MGRAEGSHNKHVEVVFAAGFIQWAELISGETRLWFAQIQKLIRRCCRDDRGKLAGPACAANHQGTFHPSSKPGVSASTHCGTDHKHLHLHLRSFQQPSIDTLCVFLRLMALQKVSRGNVNGVETYDLYWYISPSPILYILF
jgi:hypothetical protein